MQHHTFSRRSRSALLGVHPDLVLVVGRALSYTLVDFVITEGVRTPERQREVFDRGWSKTLKSKHLVQEDGFGHAVDVMAIGDLNNDGVVDHKDRAVTWNRHWYTAIANAMFKASAELGIPIRWGGDWDGDPTTESVFFDGPHFELVRSKVTTTPG